MADLIFRYGAMDCGKSTALLQSAHNYESRGMKVLVLKPKKDTKGDSKIVSRLGIYRDADHLVKPDENILDWLEKHSEGIKCVFVDEAQFLSRMNVNDLLIFASINDIDVVCYGLRSDFKTNFFPGAERLMEVATIIESKGTKCNCGRDAHFNTRCVDGRFVFEGEQVAIDGEKQVSYISLCPRCYLLAKERYYKDKGIQFVKKRDLFN